MAVFINGWHIKQHSLIISVSIHFGYRERERIWQSFNIVTILYSIHSHIYLWQLFNKFHFHLLLSNNLIPLVDLLYIDLCVHLHWMFDVTSSQFVPKEIIETMDEQRNCELSLLSLESYSIQKGWNKSMSKWVVGKWQSRWSMVTDLIIVHMQFTSSILLSNQWTCPKSEEGRSHHHLSLVSWGLILTYLNLYSTISSPFTQRCAPNDVHSSMPFRHSATTTTTTMMMTTTTGALSRHSRNISLSLSLSLSLSPNSSESKQQASDSSSAAISRVGPTTATLNLTNQPTDRPIEDEDEDGDSTNREKNVRGSLNLPLSHRY